MTVIPKHELTSVVLLTDMKAATDPVDTPDDLFPIVADWMSSLSGGGALSMISFDPNTLTRRRDAATNTTKFGIQIPEVILSPDWNYKPTGSMAHIDASIRRNL